jgi:F-type H+-transporting ATPase subunit epsilon
MTKAQPIRFVVVTPERRVVADTADAVVIPVHDGELGVLADRAPLLCELGIGQMRYRKGQRTRRLFIDGGFAQVDDNNVTVLTQNAVPVEEIGDETITEAERHATEVERAPLGREGLTDEAVQARRLAHQRVRILRKLHSAT